MAKPLVELSVSPEEDKLPLEGAGRGLCLSPSEPCAIRGGVVRWLPKGRPFGVGLLAFLLLQLLLHVGLWAQEPNRAGTESLENRSKSVATPRPAPVELADALAVESWPEMPTLFPGRSDGRIQATLPLVDGRNVACRAAQKDSSAVALRLRARTLTQLYQQLEESKRVAAHAIAQSLELLAVQQQDAAAANGLRAYYGWIASDEQATLLADTRQQLDAQEVRQRVLSSEGATTGFDMSSFRRQRIELDDRQLQLSSKQRQFAGLLSQFTDNVWEAGTIRHEALEVRPQVLNSQQLQLRALQCRSDLQAWRSLQNSLTRDTAVEMAHLISALPGGWSIPLPRFGLLGKLVCSPDHDCLTQNLASEFQATEKVLNDAICLSVSQRVDQLRLSYERMLLAQQLVDSWEARLDQFRALELAGEVRPTEQTQAYASLLAARGAELQRRLEARLAEVDLAEAVGGLAHRCCRGEAWLSSLTDELR